MEQIKYAKNRTIASIRRGCAFTFLISLAVFGAAPAARSQTQNHRPSGSSELAKRNLAHVAASASQVQEILRRNAGLLFELKSWVAREAADQGRVLGDADLTDQAVFDRLTTDTEFRAVATKLLQRYGYLIPTLNPESPEGKQQELVLQERAKRIALQELQPTVPPQSAAKDQTKKTNNCDTDNTKGCQDEDSPDSQADQNRIQDTPNFASPGGSSPSIPALPLSGSPIQKASLSGADKSMLASSTGGGDVGGMSSLGGLSGLNGASDEEKQALMAQAAQMGLGGVGSAGLPGGSPVEERDTRPQPVAPSDDVSNEPSPEPEAVPAMVRVANPYSQIPALFDMYTQANDQGTPKPFGIDVFNRGTRASHQIPMDLPAGPQYVVGPGDNLSITLWGGTSQRVVRIVDREGRLTLPEVGPVMVSGKTLGDVQQTIQGVLRTQFRDVSVDVSLSRVRTVRVYVVGAVRHPGAYDISSLSTPLNALFVAGGTTADGSLRAVRHLRGEGVVQSVDVYDLILKGIRKELQHLENGDTILVPPVGSQVTVEGAVRRSAVFELKDEKNLAEVIDLAGGMLPTASLQHIEVQRLIEHESKTMLSLDLDGSKDAQNLSNQLASFVVQNGDTVHIFPIAPFNRDSVYLQGHVFRPGKYSYKKDMRLTDLVSSYADILPEPATAYGEIVRISPPDYSPTVVSFNLKDALADPNSAPVLQPLDTVRIFGRYDFESAPTVTVTGAVRHPGTYRTSGQIRVSDAVHLAGNVSVDGSATEVQLFHRQQDGKLEVMSVSLKEPMAVSPVNSLLLAPGDHLIVHKDLSRVDPPTVSIKGEVPNPGRYPLSAELKVADLVRLAGGLKRGADPITADLTHFASGPEELQAQTETVQLSGALTGETAANRMLGDGDVLTIRQVPSWQDLGASITLTGQVQHPGTYGIKPGERLSSVLTRAGGFTSQAYPTGAVLMRKEVRDIEMTSRDELVRRLVDQKAYLKSLPDVDQDQKNAKLTAIAQTETTLDQLQSNAPIGRVVIHIQPKMSAWQNTGADIPLRDGDVLLVPKESNYIVVSGQVFHPTAVGHRSGRSARWYLSQAGGFTQLADKKAIFVVRADGSVLGATNNSNWWSGDVWNAALRPGDMIVVPEKAPAIAPRNWATFIQAGQLAASLAIAVAYLHP